VRKRDKSDSLWCVYFVRCPNTLVVVYIGITRDFNTRQKCHRMKHGGSACISMNRAGARPVVERVTDYVEYSKARNMESRLLYLHNIMYPGRLVNREETRLEDKTTSVLCIVRSNKNAKKS